MRLSPPFIAVVALFAMVALQAVRPAALLDPDMWWRLRTGEWITANWQVPRTDPFSTYGAGRPWVAYSWLFDLLLYAFYSTLGLTGVSLFVCVLWAAVAWSLFDLARSTSVPPWRAIVAIGVVLIAARGFATPRPWLLSILLLVVEIKILLAAARRENWRALWWLVPLFAVWANLHIQFVYGLLVLGIFLFTMHMPLRFGVILPATLVATLMNPYGLGVWRVVLEYARQGSLAAVITELRHPDPTAWSTWLIVAVAAWAAAMLLSGRRELLFWTLLLAAAAVLYVRTLRDGWFLVIVSGAVLLAQFAPGGKHRAVAPPLVAAAIPGVFLGLGLAAAYGYFRSDTTSAMLAREYPAEAVQYVRDHHLTGLLLNTFDWGGYLTWHLPSLPVSVDGRTNVHPASRILAFDHLWRGDVSAVPEFEAFRLVIAPVALPLTERLRRDGRFSLAHEDHRAAVFIRLR